MRFMKAFGWLGFGALFLPVFSSCAHSPEGFCQSWVESSCEVLKGCCPSQLKFDPEGCRVQLSQGCQGTLDVEKVHSGEYIFDSGAANDCFGNVKTCADAAANTHTFEQDKACANVITGYRPTGAACGSSKDCAKAGDYATCFNGVNGGGGGICAKVSLAEDNKCSFSLSTFELRVCPDGTYCDTSDVMANPDDPPSVRDFEFSAPCKKYVAAGGACDNGQVCADGLFCDFGGGMGAPTCKKTLNEGDTCNTGNECGVGLICTFDPGGNGSVCSKQGAGYCYSPAVCGDGTCDPPETAGSCPQDCGGGGGCGDFVCDPGEALTCPQDCCGDGQCEPGESAQTCPADCP